MSVVTTGRTNSVGACSLVGTVVLINIPGSHGGRHTQNPSVHFTDRIPIDEYVLHHDRDDRSSGARDPGRSQIARQEEGSGTESQKSSGHAPDHCRYGNGRHQGIEGEERIVVASHQKIPGRQLQSGLGQASAVHQKIPESGRSQGTVGASQRYRSVRTLQIGRRSQKTGNQEEGRGQEARDEKTSRGEIGRHTQEEEGTEKSQGRGTGSQEGKEGSGSQAESRETSKVSGQSEEGARDQGKTTKGRRQEDPGEENRTQEEVDARTTQNTHPRPL